MSEKKLSKEQIEALQKCKTKEEVAKFAQENQLTDEELKKITGGNVLCDSIQKSDIDIRKDWYEN